MASYLLTPKIYNRFKTMGYEMVCKICDCPLLPGDEIESKAGGKRGPKLYHRECYDGSHLQFKDHKILNGHGNILIPEDEENKGGVNETKQS